MVKNQETPNKITLSSLNDLEMYFWLHSYLLELPFVLGCHPRVDSIEERAEERTCTDEQLELDLLPATNLDQPETVGGPCPSLSGSRNLNLQARKVDLLIPVPHLEKDLRKMLLVSMGALPPHSAGLLGK